jgi:hypothetical protein
MVSCLVHVPTLHWHHHEPVRLLSNIDGLLLLKEAPEVTGEVGAEVDARWGLPAESCPVRICAGWCSTKWRSSHVGPPLAVPPNWLQHCAHAT